MSAFPRFFDAPGQLARVGLEQRSFVQSAPVPEVFGRLAHDSPPKGFISTSGQLKSVTEDKVFDLARPAHIY